MLVSQLAPATRFPHVQDFLVQVLDMQFADVRTMLQLPRPDIGIKPGCNFAIVSTLCNLISGISTTIFMPSALLSTKIPTAYGSRRAFTNLVRDYYPSPPPGVNDFPEQLYQLCRNPLAHSVALMDNAARVVVFERILHNEHADSGWSDRELEDLKHPGTPFALGKRAITIDSNRWTLCCEPFYLEVIEMLRCLNTNISQMHAAENRFAGQVFNWRR